MKMSLLGMFGGLMRPIVSASHSPFYFVFFRLTHPIILASKPTQSYAKIEQNHFS